MNAGSNRGATRHWLAKRIALVVLPAALALGVTDAAVADPPCWAPAHGHRAKHGGGPGRCYARRDERRHGRRHHKRRVVERHVYHHDVPPAEEYYEPQTVTAPASTNVTIALGDGSASGGSGAIGAVVGAALGGFLGSNVGNGNGRLAATAAGTLAGWVVGGKVANGVQ